MNLDQRYDAMVEGSLRRIERHYTTRTGIGATCGVLRRISRRFLEAAKRSGYDDDDHTFMDAKRRFECVTSRLTRYYEDVPYDTTKQELEEVLVTLSRVDRPT